MRKTSSMVLNEILNNSGENDSDQDFRVDEVLREYNVETESEFMEVLNDDWNYVICSNCLYRIDILNCQFENGSRVICPKCGYRC